MRGSTSEFTGGIRYGDSYYSAFNATWPFARLIIEADAIQLKTTFFKSFSFAKDQITGLSTYAGFLSKGLQVEHAIQDGPPFIVFWTMRLEAVKLALVKSGYTVHEKQNR